MIPDLTDPDLLLAWTHQRDEAAFESLVHRHAHLVHRAAFRTSGDAGISADASQLVFTLLARKAARLTHHPSLAGWLHLATVHTTRDLLKKANREARKIHQFQATVEPPSLAPDAPSIDLQATLDPALATLSANDRDVLLLRFYRALEVSEVARTLGIQTAAAQKRIDRALERLRRKLTRSGLAASKKPLAPALLTAFTADAQASIPLAPLLARKAITHSLHASPAPAWLASSLTKPTPAYVPTFILLAGGLFLASQFHAIASLESAQARLHRAVHATPQQAANANSATPTALDRVPVDWLEIARLLRENESFQWFKPHPWLDIRVSSLSADELQAALGQIAGARLPTDDRSLLQLHLGDALAEISPRLALDQLLPHFGEDRLHWKLGDFFNQWMARNPDEAIDWLARNAHRIGDLSFGFIETVLHPLLTSSPETAGRLIGAIPVERRLESMRSLENDELSPAQQTAWARVTRQHLPEAEALKAITWPILNWSDGDGAPMPLPDVTAYLESIDASPPERKACIIAASQEFPDLRSNPSATALDPLREWVREVEPSLVPQATGAALAAAASFRETEINQLALDFHARDRDDAILLPLIEAFDDQPDLARQLAPHLIDDTLRQKFLAPPSEPER
jgi:RNA polymerase sigma factor (sigma-70 family)